MHRHFKRDARDLQVLGHHKPVVPCRGYGPDDRAFEKHPPTSRFALSVAFDRDHVTLREHAREPGRPRSRLRILRQKAPDA